MALSVNPVFADIVGDQAKRAARAGRSLPERGDVLGLRAFLESGFPVIFGQADWPPA